MTINVTIQVVIMPQRRQVINKCITCTSVKVYNYFYSVVTSICGLLFMKIMNHRSHIHNRFDDKNGFKTKNNLFLPSKSVLHGIPFKSWLNLTRISCDLPYGFAVCDVPIGLA